MRPFARRRPLLSLSPFFLFSGDLLQMSTSSATHLKWRQYGPVPLTRCPDCPRPETMKLLVTRTDDNGNLGREFVKCLSKTMTGSDAKILKKCTHFEWMDEYVERIQFEGCIDLSGAATWELNLGGVPQMENLGSSDRGAGRVVPMARYARNVELHLESELTGELKKIKKNLMKMIDLHKQANFMAGVLLLYHCFVSVLLVVHPSLEGAFRFAEPLLEDRSQFCRMADPALQGRYPSLDLQKAVTIASFCIQEKSDMRAPISTVVKVLCRLAHDVDRPESSHHAAPN
ncbi:hypothetical protein D1007_46639 [Hordeum vulgare]|nr:hypothetical protein D1007_46639 [Hordeum vulgare]